MRKGASALEYMTDYGWMIIIVAVVVVVLFRIGLFNSGSFAARIVMGSCMLYRPNGGSTSFIDLVGLCNNGIPKFVSGFGYAGHFLQVGYSNITVSRVRFEPALSNSNNNKITITGWIYPGAPGPQRPRSRMGTSTRPILRLTAYISTTTSPGTATAGFSRLFTPHTCASIQEPSL